jgi:hypothetical protein
MVVAVSSGGCGYYSFSGTAIPDHIQTIAIPLFEDVSRSAVPGLPEQLTELLIGRFVQQTRLALSTDDVSADALLFGSLQRYRNEPTSVGGQERATLNRVTISVSVTYRDQTREQEVLNRTFSASGEYDPVAGGLEGEVEAATFALEQLAEDIFTAATSNW